MTSRAPAPVAYLRHILAVLADVELVSLHGRPVPRRRGLYLIAEPRNAKNGIQRQSIAVEIVENNHVKRRRGGPLLLESPDVDVVVIVPPIGQPMDECRIAMKGKDHRPIGRE